jgi:hypothetical protein
MLQISSRFHWRPLRCRRQVGIGRHFLGALLGLLRPTLRVPIGVVLVVALGLLATVVSGEYLVSWSFLLIDIPLVAVSAAASLFVTHRLRWVRRPR